MGNRRFTLSVVIAVLTLVVASHQGCKGPDSTSTGNPSSPSTAVSMKIAAFNGTVGSNSVQMLKMCLQRLRLKGSSGSGDSGNIDLNLGEIQVTPAGVDLSSVQVPEGTFDRIEFDLSNSCGTGESLSVINNSGTLITTDSMTIGFDGTVSVSNSQTVTLLIQQIVNALAPVTNANNLKDAAESTSGGCD